MKLTTAKPVTLKLNPKKPVELEDLPATLYLEDENGVSLPLQAMLHLSQACLNYASADENLAAIDYGTVLGIDAALKQADGLPTFIDQMKAMVDKQTEVSEEEEESTNEEDVLDEALKRFDPHTKA